jgi:hypothetical protein
MGNIKPHILDQNCIVSSPRQNKLLFDSHLIGPNRVNFKKMTPKALDTEEDI